MKLEGRRWVITLKHHEGKKIATKSAKDTSKKGAINKEQQILMHLQTAKIWFTPQLIDSWDGWFSYDRIEGEHFKTAYARASMIHKKTLVLKLLERAYTLDTLWIVHGEFIRPFTNMLVNQQGEISIIDFERWWFGDKSGKNMRSLSQWLLGEQWIRLQDAKQLWTLDADAIYIYVKKIISQKKSKATITPSSIFLRIPVLITLDQLTKYLFFDLEWWSAFTLLTPAFNTWIWWSLPIPLQIVIWLSLVICIAIFYAWKYTYLDTVSFILITSGAIWNLIDRIWLSWVRDFVDLQYRPIFNAADVYLSLAIIYLIYYQFKQSYADN